MSPLGTAAAAPDFERQTLEEAIHSPSVAMMRLSIEIDRQLRLILAVVGRLKDYNGLSPTDALDLIAKSTTEAVIPSELREILKAFWDLRNNLVHGGRSNQVLSMRAVDYGLRIFRLIQSIPRPRYVVVATVPLWADQPCLKPRNDVAGVILQSWGAKGENGGRHVHPSRKDYTEGQSVSWEWDMNGPGWGETWYREPETGEVELAWSESLEFIGRPLELI